MNRRNYALISVVAVVISLLILGSKMFFVLKPGERAAVFKQISSVGLDKDNILVPGFLAIAPWNKLISYDVREQKSEETMDVLDKEGLSINVDVTIIFNPYYNKIGYLHENIGASYVSVMVIPNVRSSVRDVTGRYTAEEIYSTKCVFLRFRTLIPDLTGQLS